MSRNVAIFLRTSDGRAFMISTGRVFHFLRVWFVNINIGGIIVDIARTSYAYSNIVGVSPYEWIGYACLADIKGSW